MQTRQSLLTAQSLKVGACLQAALAELGAGAAGQALASRSLAGEGAAFPNRSSQESVINKGAMRAHHRDP